MFKEQKTINMIVKRTLDYEPAYWQASFYGIGKLTVQHRIHFQLRLSIRISWTENVPDLEPPHCYHQSRPWESSAEVR